MGDGSKIEWTEATWNPVVGCAKVSAGCDNCYAAKESAGRLSHLPQYKGLATRVNGVPEFTGEIRCLPERLDQPLRWRRPRLVFVNSMSDLFHPDVPTGFILDVWATMAAATHHTFQVLTKRPQRMAEVLGRVDDHLLPNVWLGTSIESDRYTFRANHLRFTPAAIRFLSLEPLLGPLPSLDLTNIHWVIVGGESGPRARPMHPDWVRDIRDRCVAAGIPFFFKQWGQWAPLDNHPGSYTGSVKGGHVGHNGEWGSPTAKIWGTANPPEFMVGLGKKAAGRGLDGRTWDEMPVGVAA